MKKYIIALLIVFGSSLAANADVSSCGEVGKTIADFEERKNSGSSNEKQTARSVLAAMYKSYYAKGCTEAELRTYFPQGKEPRSKAQVK